MKPRSTSNQQMHGAFEATSSQRITITRDDGVQDTVFGRVVTPDGHGDVLLTDGFVDHLIDGHPGRTLEEFANFLLPSLRNPAEVWLKPHLIDNRIVYRRVFVTAFENNINTVFVVQEDSCGSLAWTFFPEKRINRRRAGHLLYRRPG